MVDYHLCFVRNSGLQNQSVIYVQDTLESEPRVLFDPNSLAEDGTISLGHAAWSHDGLVFAYSLSTSGSDWQVIKFRNVETGEISSKHFIMSKNKSQARTILKHWKKSNLVISLGLRTTKEYSTVAIRTMTQR